MSSKRLVKAWFAKWEEGDFHHLPISKNFRHTSPFGTIEGKKAYLDLVEANRDKFLGYTFQIVDEIFEFDKACVRYRAIQNDFKLDVSEWHYVKNGLIDEIVAYYHICDIRADRELSPSGNTG